MTFGSDITQSYVNHLGAQKMRSLTTMGCSKRLYAQRHSPQSRSFDWRMIQGHSS